MIKLFFTSILLLCASLSNASTVRLTDVNEPDVKMGTIYTPFVSLGGDATTTSAPLKIYMPLSDGADQDENHILGTNLFSSASTDGLKIKVDVNNDTGNTLYPTLYVDDPNSTNYIFVARSVTGCFGNSTCDDLEANFPIDRICINGDIDCSNLTSVKTATLYLFLSETAIDGDINDPSSGTDGLFVELNISGVVYNGSAALNIQPVLTNVTTGDTRLKYEYTLSSVQTHFRDIWAYDNTVAISGASSFSDLHGNKELLVEEDEVSVNSSGYFDLKNLENEKVYQVTIAIRDKFGFFTLFSDSLEGKAQTIAEFLEKNQCYLVSAGFLEQHYVLDYFRHIRDDYLLNYSLGEKFVDFYYATAPKYVPFILEHESLRFVIRMMSFALYFVFNYGLYLLGFAFLVRFLKFMVSKVSFVK